MGAVTTQRVGGATRGTATPLKIVTYKQGFVNNGRLQFYCT